MRIFRAGVRNVPCFGKPFLGTQELVGNELEKKGHLGGCVCVREEIPLKRAGPGFKKEKGGTRVVVQQ